LLPDRDTVLAHDDRVWAGLERRLDGRLLCERLAVDENVEAGRRRRDRQRRVTCCRGLRERLEHDSIVLRFVR
jgi:hypothetical protein